MQATRGQFTKGSKHMPSLLIAVLLLVLTLALPGATLAGPPEGVSGKMVLDEVADGVRKYRKETDARRRGELLRRLAPTRDLRVAMALGVAMMEGGSSLGREVDATELLNEWFLSDDDDFSEVHRSVRIWWKKNEADLRRRAIQLPQ